jgi:hypothetical protein
MSCSGKQNLGKDLSEQGVRYFHVEVSENLQQNCHREDTRVEIKKRKCTN